MTGEPTKSPPKRDDHSCAPLSVSHARIALSRPAPNSTPDAVTITPLSIPGAPVLVIPRAANSGSSPKPTRHLMAGAFRSYFTIDVKGGAIRLPTVLYSLITGRSYCATPSGYAGSAPRPSAAGTSGRVHAEPAPTISSRGAPELGEVPPRSGPPAPEPGPQGAAVNNATSALTSAAAKCGKDGIRPLPAAI